MKGRQVLAALLLTLAATPAVAQSVYSGCVQRDTPNCRAVRERHQLGVYGVRPVDQLAREDVATYRLFVLDAHHIDIGLIAFSRDHGGTPRLSLQSPGYGLNRPPPLSIAIPLDMWEEERDAAAGFRGRRMADPGHVCDNAWTFIVESGTPAEGAAGPRPTVELVDQCAGSAHTYRLAERALRAFPTCGPLVGPSATLYEALMTCAILRAEPAAVETWVALAPMFARGSRDTAGVRAAFAPDAVLDWDRGPESAGTAADRWLREMQARDAAFGFDRIDRLAGGRARLTGYIDFTHREGQDEAREFRARAVLELARDGTGRLRIVSARIARYHRL